MIRTIVMSAVLAGGAVSAQAAGGLFTEGDRLLIQTSLWTTHYSPEPDHNNKQELVGLEWQAPEDWRFGWQRDGAAVQRTPWLKDVKWVVGGATFRNSFSQRTHYVYGGARYDFHQRGNARFYGKLTAGLIHGYRGEYRDKIPFNRYGTAPAILPAFGMEYRRFNVEVIPFGSAGLMINAGLYAF